jgi:hypothetical protein
MADYIPRAYPLFRVWLTNFDNVAQAYQAAWGLPAEECVELHDAAVDYAQKDDLADSPHATAVNRLERKEANEALIHLVRRFVNKFINLNDAVGDPQRLDLGLHLRNTSHTPTPQPSAQAEAEIRFPGIHLVELYITKIISTGDPSKSDYGARIYFGLMPQGGATVEAATGPRRELMAPPQTGEELPHSVFTRRKTHRFDFAESDRGKRVYFCIRYENSKGQAGPWGPIFSAIIP